MDATHPGAPDALGVDDRAWAVVPPKQQRQVLLAGEPDPYLETALSFLPDTELYFRNGDDWSTLDGARPVRARDLQPLPAADAAGASRSSRSRRRGRRPSGTVTGTLTNPGIGTLDPADPILRYVDLSTVHVGEAQKLELPAWARAVDPGPGGLAAALLRARSTAGRPRSSRSSRATRTCRSRSRSRSCSRTSRAS